MKKISLIKEAKNADQQFFPQSFLTFTDLKNLTPNYTK